MEKEKLLSVIQQEKKGLDEREQIIKDSSYHWGYFSSLMIILVLMIVRMIGGELFTQDLMVIVMGQISFISLYEYTKNKDKKTNLYVAIFGLLVTLGSLYNTLKYYEII